MNQERSLKGYLGVSARGLLMGAADVVPGVSGGTIAFMTGIYQELIHALRQCGPEALTILFRQGIAPAWRHINGNFLVAVFSGVLLSLISLSHVVLNILTYYPILLWSFFFGLILAGVWSVVRHVDRWSAGVIAAFIFGAIVAYGVTVMSPSQVEATKLMVFLSGMIAICAMILPGISGSFILLLMGMYAPMLEAIKNVEFTILVLFASGCVIGLLSFSRILNYMFEHYKTLTLALLGGFMLGSLNKVWPWKQTLESFIDRHGKEVPLVQTNLWPQSFEAATQQPAFLGTAIALMLLGMLLVVLMEKLGASPD